MASSLRAYCTACRFKGTALFGAFRFVIESGNSQCFVPAIHKPTGKLEGIDIYDSTKKQEEYSFYTDPSMYEGEIIPMQTRTINCFDQEIKMEHNRCPNCNQYNMFFFTEITFD